MPDRELRDAYLERLADAMALPDAERGAAAEEIAAHIDEAMADMQSRGLPADVAERRALEHLGPPERLADDLTAARRQGSHALAAVGTALRVTIVTGLQYLLFAWAVIILAAIAVSLAVAGIGRLLGTAILEADWTPVTAGLLPAVVACAVSYGIGRTILPPVAASARRPAWQVRIPLALSGAAITAWVAIAVVAAPYHLASALVMGSAPAWFLLGILPHHSRPAPVLSTRALVFTLAVFGIGGAGLVFATGGSPTEMTSTDARAFDPNVEYARVGPFVDLEHPPIELAASSGMLERQGPGPVRLERSATVPAGVLAQWRDVRLEVWAGPVGVLNGPGIDPNATEPLGTGAMMRDGRWLTGIVDFQPLPDREQYYVAITGIGADGVRMQLGWPDTEWWRWEGTVVDLVRTALRP